MSALPAIEYEELSYGELLENYGHDNDVLHKFLVFMRRCRAQKINSLKFNESAVGASIESFLSQGSVMK